MGLGFNWDKVKKNLQSAQKGAKGATGKRKSVIFGKKR
jgi:hypothetical protein